MNDFKNIIRSIIEDALITDDVLFKQRTIPCVVNNVEQEQDDNYMTSKYELYLMIQDAINIYNHLDDNEFEKKELNEAIHKLAKQMRNIRTSL